MKRKAREVMITLKMITFNGMTVHPMFKGGRDTPMEEKILPSGSGLIIAGPDQHLKKREEAR